jgi:bifunctional DNA-binding transcriptional regulator/antitoxin component of YhaV-PrlF toxin-antitoxin module
MRIPDTARSHTLDVQEDSDGQYLIFPDEDMELLGWKEGDDIEWIDNGNGSWTLRKKEMSKVMIEMEDEQIDAIVIQELKNAIESFEQSIEERSNGEGLAFFDNDPIKDIDFLLDHVRAFTTVLEYYGGSR